MIDKNLNLETVYYPRTVEIGPDLSLYYVADCYVTRKYIESLPYKTIRYNVVPSFEVQSDKDKFSVKPVVPVIKLVRSKNWCINEIEDVEPFFSKKACAEQVKKLNDSYIEGRLKNVPVPVAVEFGAYLKKLRKSLEDITENSIGVVETLEKE